MTRLAPAPRPTAAGERLRPLPASDPISRLPIVVLALNQRCNCRCAMCDIWQSPDRAELGAAEVARHLPEWRRLGVERAVLTGGEPLLAREVWAIAALLHEAGIGLTLLTTGLLLARDAGRVAALVDDVIVSLDGPPEIHDRIRRVPRAFARLGEGVAALRAAAPAVAISGRSTVQRANFRHLRGTVAAARALGLDRLSFLAADVSSEAFHRPRGWSAERRSEVALAPEELPELAAELAALEREHVADFAQGFLAESPEKLQRRIYRHFAAVAGQGDFPPVACNAPWVSAVLEAGEALRPCFFQPAYGAMDGGFRDRLNAPAAIAWRRGLDVGKDPTCRRCVCSLELRSPLPAAGEGPGERAPVPPEETFR